MEWITPDRLIACIYKSRPESAQRSARLWNEGAALAPDIQAIRNEHLRYNFGLAQKGMTFAAGPFADFSGGLRILSVDSIDEARKAITGGPYFTNSFHYGEEFHEWIIHMPLEKASSLHKNWLEKGLKKLGIVPPKIVPQWTTPEKLFVCLCKRSPSHAQRPVEKGAAISAEAEAVFNEHLRYAYGLGERGITWAGGPFADSTGTLSIYAVNTFEEARKVKREDPFYKNGFIYDDRYFEWTIHGPLAKAAPAHKERLQAAYLKAGITV